MTYLLLLIGFVFLIKGAGYLVDGASSLAKRFSIPDLVIGLTIVAFGTSAPELFVNLFASFNGTTDIAIGNILGSNVANTLLILGIAAVIYPITVTKQTTWKEIPFSLLAALVVLFMASDVFLDGAAANFLSRIDGLVLMSFFAIFLYYTFGSAKSAPASETDSSEAIVVRSAWASTGLVIGGLVGLVIGGQWIVDGATTIAQTFGLSDALIGLTIVAIGTSLPELATSAVAAYKKNSDIAIGNVVGSNIFNIFWILGLSATISPLPFKSELVFDALVTVAVSVVLFCALFIGKRHTLERWQGVVFILLYITYVAAIIVRG